MYTSPRPFTLRGFVPVGSVVTGTRSVSVPWTGAVTAGEASAVTSFVPPFPPEQATAMMMMATMTASSAAPRMMSCFCCCCFFCRVVERFLISAIAFCGSLAPLAVAGFMLRLGFCTLF